MVEGESDAGFTVPVSWASTPGTRASMRSNRGRDTSPEMVVRRRLHALGYRYRVSVRPIPKLRRTSDIVFPRRRIAVFIDGCFWHGCPEHYQAPVRNGSFWAEKVAANRRRDRETDERLREEGWLSLRIWEHDVRRDPDRAVASIVAALEHR